MSSLLTGPIESVAEFLAHALEMEVESAERYRELADNMAVHNNPGVAELFRQLAVEGDAHAAHVERRGAGVALPDIAPWAFKWSSPDGPESLPLDELHYLMSRHQALELALHNEIRGRDFYAELARASKNAEVRALAAEMAEEEGRHVAMLRDWLASEAVPEPSTPDLDPPHSPE
jgi:rubrerythrin